MQIFRNKWNLDQFSSFWTKTSIKTSTKFVWTQTTQFPTFQVRLGRRKFSEKRRIFTKLNLHFHFKFYWQGRLVSNNPINSYHMHYHYWHIMYLSTSWFSFTKVFYLRERNDSFIQSFIKSLQSFLYLKLYKWWMLKAPPVNPRA